MSLESLKAGQDEARGGRGQLARTRFCSCDDWATSAMTGFVFPPPLAPGDRIAVVAPSSPFPRAELLRGLAWLRDRYRIVARTSVLARAGFLAGDDAARARRRSPRR